MTKSESEEALGGREAARQAGGCAVAVDPGGATRLRSFTVSLPGRRDGIVRATTDSEEAAGFFAGYLGARPADSTGPDKAEIRLLSSDDGFVVEGPSGREFFEKRGFLGPALIEFVRQLRIAALDDRDDLLALHTAAVEISGAALLLVGEPGSGKSTLAAALALSGAGFLADDFVVLERKTGRALPHPEAVSLSGESAGALGLEWSRGRIWPGGDDLRRGKRYFPELRSAGRGGRGAPLAAVVLLDPAEERGRLRAERTAAGEGVVRLVRAVAGAREDFERALSAAAEFAERTGASFWRMARGDMGEMAEACRGALAVRKREGAEW